MITAIFFIVLFLVIVATIVGVEKFFDKFRPQTDIRLRAILRYFIVIAEIFILGWLML